MDGRTDGQTDEQTCTTKLIFAYRSFANAPEDDLSVTYDENKITPFIVMRILVYIIVVSLM
jgi:hypothetical protein